MTRCKDTIRERIDIEGGRKPPSIIMGVKERELAYIQLAHALGADRGTMRRYLEPVLDKRYRIRNDPTKLAFIHDLILKMGVYPKTFIL